jgi:hypothetical protein
MKGAGHGAGIEARHVQAGEPDGGQVGQRLGRRRVDGREDVAEAGQAGDGGHHILVDRRGRLDLQHDAVGRHRQHVEAQQQRRGHREVGRVVRRHQLEVDVGEGLQQGPGAEARGRRRRVGVAGQDFVADDRARGVADGLADADDGRRRGIFGGGGGL